MVYNFSFYKTTSRNVVKSEIMSNQESAKELPKAIIRKFEKRKVYSFFKYNIWSADLRICN